MEQRTIPKRLAISLPMFGASVLLLVWQMENPDGFNTIWQYFGWGNQTLSVFTLWAITVYLAKHHKPYVISLIPALFMTTVCTTFIFVSPNMLGTTIPTTIGYILGAVCLAVAIGSFSTWLVNFRKLEKNNKELSI